jgi:hypothetical protein
VLDFIYGGVMVVTWFHEKLAQVTKSYLGYSLTITQDVCGENHIKSSNRFCGQNADFLKKMALCFSTTAMKNFTNV